MNSDIFHPDFKPEPYWWERTPRPVMADVDLPARADVVIIGSGYTGLCAAIETARGGRDTLVLDAEDAGWGCSSRNGGQISTSIKPGFSELSGKFGEGHAEAILAEGHLALTWIGDFIAAEGIDCDFERVGRFHAAHTPAQFEVLAKTLADQPKGLKVDAHMLSRAEQHQEIDGDFYYGGIVYNSHASLDPGRYHQGLLERALTAGATIVAHCPAVNLQRDGDDVLVSTPRGVIRAGDVIVATSGYTGSLTPWAKRRIIPIGSYIIATEPLAADEAARLIPNNRVVSDTRKLVVYYRLSPDRRRILFGARVSIKETDPRTSAPLLHDALVRRFPQLSSTRVTHSWMGFVGYTFDKMPHLGKQDGVHYSMGYCGSGVSLASYFGTRIGQQVLGKPEGRTALDDIAFPSRPYYWGNPWFLAASVGYYKWLDERGR